MVIGLHHIQITVPPDKIEAARRFYTDILGMTPMEDLFPDSKGFWLKAGEHEVHVRPEVGIAHTATRAHPAYVVDNLEQVRAKLQATRVPIDPQPDIPGLARFHTFDPAGNRLEVIQRI